MVSEFRCFSLQAIHYLTFVSGAPCYGRKAINLMHDYSLRQPILEPLGLYRAIPSIKEHRRLPAMDVNDAVEDDGQLLHLMMAGQEQGFVALYRKYQGPVYRFTLHICGTRHIAEDVSRRRFSY